MEYKKILLIFYEKRAEKFFSKIATFGINSTYVMRIFDNMLVVVNDTS